MTDRRHRRPLPLGGEDGLPFSKGLLARALIGTGISTDRAYELALAAEDDIAQSGRESISFERLGELARETLGEADGAHDAPAPPLPGSLRPRPAGDPADRRRHRHRQVDGRHGCRLPARDHARHLDRLRPPDDASVLLARVHAGDPLLELRGRPRDRRRGRGGQRGRARRLPRADPRRARRRAGRDRARARGGLVDGARGRPPRAGHAAARDRGRAGRPVRARDQRRRGAREPLLDPRLRLRGRPAVREVPRRLRRHPAGAGVHPGTGEQARGAGDRERQHRGRDRRGDGARAERCRAAGGAT